jgi:hypothetical protein
MTSAAALTLLGFSLGALLIADKRADPRADPRASMTLRGRAIAAQKASARASQIARDLTAQWSAEEAASRTKVS